MAGAARIIGWRVANEAGVASKCPTLDSRPGVCIPADTARFAYDATGRMVQADNMYARVRRDHYRNGLLRTETQRVRTYYRSGALNACGEESPTPQTSSPSLEWDFNQHVYTTTRVYDRDGRRLSITHPAAGGTQTYSYGSNESGRLLTSVTDPLGNVVSFSYDFANRLFETTYPGTVRNTVTFDNGGRMNSKTLTASGTQAIYANNLARDGQGRVVSGSVRAADGSLFDVNVWYNGLGAVVAAWGVTRHSTLEEMTPDALGNRSWHRVSNALPNHTDRHRRMTYSAEQLLLVFRNANDPKPYPEYDYRQEYLYDASRNVHRTWGYEVLTSGRMDDEAVSYYGADDKLRIYNRHLGLGTGGQPGSVYEEYRYDALGRRVLTRSRSTASCIGAGPECNSYIERTAWDGDQVIYEVRGRGKQGATPAELNSDHASGTSSDHWSLGRVRYTHAGAIDAPLTIIRQNMQGFPTLAVAPHANWQGDFEVGSMMSGELTSACYSGGCPPIAWPGHQKTADGESTLDGSPSSWFGSLVALKTDGSGLQYLRNRYYDPKTGRFTQEDPIGLAGGLNLYGFAGGDPVNFSDPFGLIPCWLAGAWRNCQDGALRAASALLHYVTGRGRERQMSFADIDTRQVRATDFAAVSQAINRGESGTFEINTRTGFATFGAQAAYLGNITLELSGTLTVNCEGTCSWSFSGTMSAAPDVYDANPSDHRTPAAEASTAVLRKIPGKPYRIQIVGERQVSESGSQ
jgi:RHS repeat-associated protein